MAKEKTFAVFGLGAFGQEVCRYLTANGAQVIAVDNDAQIIERIKDGVHQAVHLNSTDEDALSAGLLENVDAAVIAMGGNVESSVLTTALLKKIGVPRIVARAVSELHLRVLRQVGADEVFNLEIEEGRRVAAQLLSRDVLDNIPISEDLSITEMLAPEALVGESVASIGERFGVNLVAVKRTHTTVDELGNPVRRQTVFLPRAGEELQENDVFLVAGSNESVERIRRE